MQEVEKRDEISWKLPPRAYGSCQLAAAFMRIVIWITFTVAPRARRRSARRALPERACTVGNASRRRSIDAEPTSQTRNRCQTHELPRPYAQAKDSRTGVQLPPKRAVCVGVRVVWYVASFSLIFFLHQYCSVVSIRQRVVSFLPRSLRLDEVNWSEKIKINPAQKFSGQPTHIRPAPLPPQEVTRRNKNFGPRELSTRNDYVDRSN
jgi:hypothetical protein